MIIAAFNVENLFDRAKAFNADDPEAHRDVLDAHAELNTLFAMANYTAIRKTRMLALIEQLGMLKRDEGPLTRIRKIRGQLISRPRTKPPYIKANGRDDWVGWCELRTSAVNELAIENTARVIRDVGPDVLAIVEAESRPVLKSFHDEVLCRLAADSAFAHLMIIDGNDNRGIDVGLMTKAGYQLSTVRSHVDDLKPDGHPVFSRDCPEYRVTTPSGARVMVLPNHFKSKYGGNDPTSRAKRLAQSNAVAGFYERLKNDEGYDYVVVLGDLNDTPDSSELAPLLDGTDLKDVSEHEEFTEFEFLADNGHRGIGTHGLGNDDDKIDYILLSPKLYKLVKKGGIFRKGVWPGSRPKRWDVYPEIKKKHHTASDHHAMWVDINL